MYSDAYAAMKVILEATTNGILFLVAGQGFLKRLNYYDRRPRLSCHGIDRLQRNETTPIQEIDIIKKVADHIYILMTESIFVTAGKLRQGAELYRRYVNF